MHDGGRSLPRRAPRCHKRHILRLIAASFALMLLSASAALPAAALPSQILCHDAAHFTGIVIHVRSRDCRLRYVGTDCSPTGLFELTIRNEELLERDRSNLRAGDTLVTNVSVGNGPEVFGSLPFPATVSAVTDLDARPYFLGKRLAFST